MRPRTQFDIDVTQTDIDYAHRGDSYKCMAALAIRRTIPEATNVEVDTQTVRFTLDDRRLMYLTPPIVESYVIAFDYGDPMRPFSFRLRSPMEARRRVRTQVGLTKERERRRQKRATTSATPAQSEDVEPAPAAQSEDVAREPESVGVVGRAAFAALTEPQSVTLPGTKRPTRRVFKGKQRRFGQRVLRINQTSEGNP